MVALPPGTELVIATDTVCAGTHFSDETPPRTVGHRSLAVNLSDLAAMGADPLWCTLALSVERADADWLADFSDGFFALAERCGIELVGGDTVRGPLAVTVTVHGAVPAGAAVTRDGAGVGDGVYVTGTPGDASAGLGLVDTGPVSADNRWLLERFHYPQPRLAAGRTLRNIASAMIDISDGLHVDLCRLLAASDVGARLDVERLPLSEPLLRHAGRAGAVACALSGGDDYELCFTVPDEHASRLTELVESWDCRCTRIGRVVAQGGASWQDGGVPFAVPDPGFRHFRP